MPLQCQKQPQGQQKQRKQQRARLRRCRQVLPASAAHCLHHWRFQSFRPSHRVKHGWERDWEEARMQVLLVAVDWRQLKALRLEMPLTQHPLLVLLPLLQILLQLQNGSDSLQCSPAAAAAAAADHLPCPGLELTRFRSLLPACPRPPLPRRTTLPSCGRPACARGCGRGACASRSTSGREPPADAEGRGGEDGCMDGCQRARMNASRDGK